MKETWVIIKVIINRNGLKQPIILMHGDEVWEFDNEKTAADIASTLEQNSDSGWHYYAKKTSSITSK